MAIYHLRAKVRGRNIRTDKSGNTTRLSSVAAAAYRSGERLKDELLEQWFGRKPKDGHVVEHTNILLPDDAPEWAKETFLGEGGRAALWNAIELSELNLVDGVVSKQGKLREKAQLYREIEVTLPRELPRKARIALLERFVTEQFLSQGMVADIAIHDRPASDGGRQPHGHVMLTLRPLETRPKKLAKGVQFGAKNRDWNMPDALYEEIAQLKALVGQLKNDMRRHGDSAPLSQARNGVVDYLSRMGGEATRHRSAIKRMRRYLAQLDGLIETFGPDARLDVAHKATTMTLEPKQQQMPLYQWRQAWAKAVNGALDEAGDSSRIDHRTLKAQRQEALRNAQEAEAAQDFTRAAKEFARAERLNREPQRPLGIFGHIQKITEKLRDNIHNWAAIEVRGRMERAFGHIDATEPATLQRTILRLRDWTDEVIDRFNRRQALHERIPEVQREPRP